jgi:hypothetical protein
VKGRAYTSCFKPVRASAIALARPDLSSEPCARFTHVGLALLFSAVEASSCTSLRVVESSAEWKRSFSQMRPMGVLTVTRHDGLGRNSGPNPPDRPGRERPPLRRKQRRPGCGSLAP